MVVRVRGYRSRVPLGPQQLCTDLGFLRTLVVPLHNPLAGRAVEDGHERRRHRLAPVPLEPSWLPDGWRLVGESGSPEGGGRDTWERSYGPGPDVGAAGGGVGVSQVTVADGAANVGRPGPAPSEVVARPAVRGVVAVVERFQGEQDMAVRWREGRD